MKNNPASAYRRPVAADPHRARHLPRGKTPDARDIRQDARQSGREENVNA